MMTDNRISRWILWLMMVGMLFAPTIVATANTEDGAETTTTCNNRTTDCCYRYHSGSEADTETTTYGKCDLGDRVFNDVDQDGIQDAGEGGVPNILVKLYDNSHCSGSADASDTTDSNGYYKFSNLRSGDYCLLFKNIPSNYSVSPKDQGNDGSKDSDGVYIGNGVAKISGIDLRNDDLIKDLGLYQSGGGGNPTPTNVPPTAVPPTATPPPTGGNVDIAISTYPNTDSVNVGESFNFFIYVENKGPGTATNVQIEDVLPSCVSLRGAYPGQGTYANNVWNVGELTSGSYSTISFWVDATTAGTCTNSATVVNVDQTDSNPANNSGSTSVTIGGGGGGNPTPTNVPPTSVPPTAVPPTATPPPTGGAVDVRVDTYASVDSVNVGESFNYFIYVENKGTSDATNVQLQDILPSCVTLRGAYPGQGTYANGVWNVGTIAAGGYSTISFWVDATTGGACTNTVSVLSVDQTDSNPGNDTDSVTVTINGGGGGNPTPTSVPPTSVPPTSVPPTSVPPTAVPPTATPPPTGGNVDIRVDTYPSNDAVNVGDNFNYFIFVENKGTSDATNVQVQDILPSCVTLRGAYPGQGTYANGIWNIGTLPAGSYTTISFWVEAAAGGTCTNTATLTNVDQTDSNPGNDSDSTSVTINGGGGATYSVGDRVFADDNQNGLQDGGEAGIGGVAVALFDNANCSGSAIANTTTNGSGNYGFTGVAAGTYCIEFGNFPANAVVSPANQGLNDAVDSDGVDVGGGKARIQNVSISADTSTNDLGLYVPTQGGGQADLQLSTYPSTDTAQTGESFNFFIYVENKGPDTATNVKVRDVLPSCVILRGAYPGQGSYANGVWSVGDLSAGSAATISFWVEAATAGACVNVVEVIAVDQTDIDSSPNNDDGDQSEDDEDSTTVTIGGVQPSTYALAGRIFRDTNANGIQDFGENGEANVTVQLFANGTCSGSATASRVTGSDGGYSFADLAPSNYCVKASNLPAGASISPKDQGGNDALDSDAVDLGNGMAAIQNIGLSADSSTNDFGIYVVAATQPNAVISAAPVTGDAPLSVSFDGYQSQAFNGATLVSFVWNFGDGNTATGITAQNVYTQPGTYTAQLTVTDSNGNTDTDTVQIVVTQGNTGPSCQQDGLLVERWWGVWGDDVSDLLNDHDYPDNPDDTLYINHFETGSNLGYKYGQRVRGYIEPTVSGHYTFWLSSDDASRLYLSTDDNPANAVKIAKVTSYTLFRIFDWYDEQKSAQIYLEAGQRYYIEALHKAGLGSDHLSVAWRGPGQNRHVIPNSVLCAFTGNTGSAPTAALSANPTSGTAPLSVSFNGSGSNDNGGSIVAYSWDFGNGATASGATTSYTYNAPGTYHATLTVTDNDGNTATATQKITVNSAHGGGSCYDKGLTWDIWSGIYGAKLSFLYGLLSYPHSPSHKFHIFDFEMPYSYGHNYGSRVHGYVIPPVTGDYEFFLSSGDESELFLSTDSNPDHASKIAHVSVWTWPHNYSFYHGQKSVKVHLQAGQAYYIKALQKKGWGSDHLDVAWKIPGGVIELIKNKHLCPYDDGGRVAQLPLARTTDAPTAPNTDVLQLSNRVQAFPTELYDDVILLLAGNSELRTRSTMLTQELARMIENGEPVSAEFIAETTAVYDAMRAVATPELRTWMEEQWPTLDLDNREGQAADVAWQEIDGIVPTAISLSQQTTGSSSVVMLLLFSLTTLFTLVILRDRRKGL